MKNLDNILIFLGIAGIVADMYANSQTSNGTPAVPSWYVPISSLESKWPLPGSMWYYALAGGLVLKYKDKLKGMV